VLFNRLHMKNASVNQPGTNGFLYYSDTSTLAQVQLSHPVGWGFQVGGAFGFFHTRLGRAPPNPDARPPDPDFFFDPVADSVNPGYRGLGQSFSDRMWAVGISRDTRNNENITLAGSRLSMFWRYHDVALDHDFHEWQGHFTKFFKLGKERYEVTDEEEREMGDLRIGKFLRQLEYDKLRRQIFSRKVVVVRVYGGQSFELPGNSMPLYGLQTLGNDTPLRGYSGSRFRHYAVGGLSTEYRFPVMRLMDGVLFNEYGVTGRSWEDIDYLKAKNSWGFGIRVRRPDIFLFRAEVGIHGFSGMVFNLSVDAPF
jgi:outer membrane protein assembly factor BamA